MDGFNLDNMEIVTEVGMFGDMELLTKEEKARKKKLQEEAETNEE